MSKTKTYLMKINGKWLQGFEEPEYQPNAFRSRASVPVNAGVLLTDYYDTAKPIEGNFNLKSAFDKLYERMRYDRLDIKKLEVEVIGEDNQTNKV